MSVAKGIKTKIIDPEQGYTITTDEQGNTVLTFDDESVYDGKKLDFSKGPRE